MTQALIVVEVEGALGSDLQVAAIPEVVLDDIRFCAHRRGRSLWAEILARLSGTRGAPPPGRDRSPVPPLLSGTRVRAVRPRPAAAR